jgi:hypothetical protein
MEGPTAKKCIARFSINFSHHLTLLSMDDNGFIYFKCELRLQDVITYSRQTILKLHMSTFEASFMGYEIGVSVTVSYPGLEDEQVETP